MPRQTRQELDAEIIDHAAELFARHGVAHTSLQQIADAVGYSKAGLLHHFPSKAAISDAVLATVASATAELAHRVSALPAGETRDRALIESLVDNALDRPGIAAFLGRLATDPGSSPPQLAEAGLELARAFGMLDAGEDPARVVRVLMASAGVQLATEVAVQTQRRREWRATIIATAMETLGYDRT